MCVCVCMCVWVRNKNAYMYEWKEVRMCNGWGGDVWEWEGTGMRREDE